MIKKELFDKYGLFDNKFKVCEDYELWLRITSKIKIGYLDKPLIKKYGGHKGSFPISIGVLIDIELKL